MERFPLGILAVFMGDFEASLKRFAVADKAIPAEDLHTVKAADYFGSVVSAKPVPSQSTCWWNATMGPRARVRMRRAYSARVHRDMEKEATQRMRRG